MKNTSKEKEEKSEKNIKWILEEYIGNYKSAIV